MAGLAAEHGEETTVMIDATCLKAHRTATSMAVIKGRPLDLFVTAGQVSDYIGARALLSSLLNVGWRMSNGCSGIAVTTPTGFEKP